MKTRIWYFPNLRLRFQRDDPHCNLLTPHVNTLRRVGDFEGMPYIL